MKKVIHVLMLSCLKATELIEKQFQMKLTAKERIQLKMHTSMCKACKSYGEQSEVLEKALCEVKSEEITEEEVSKLKESILNTLNSK